MIKKELQDKLNSQINFEIESAHIYLAMAGFVAEQNFDGFTNFFMIQYEEELFHAKKMMNYLIERGGRIDITGFDTPKNKYESILEVFETAYKHELIVTSRINDLVDLATELRDHASISFLHWYVDEQVEEEATFEGIINKLKLLDNVGTYLLDQELSTRVFTPPTA